MKIVVFSDIHGNIFAFKQFINEISKIKYDKLIFCGDIFGYYYNQYDIVNELKDMDKLVWVLGNHDKYALDLFENKRNAQSLITDYGHSYQNVNKLYMKQNMELLYQKKTFEEIVDNGYKIAIFHGGLENYLEERVYPDTNIENKEKYKKYNIVFLGHTHCKMVRGEDDFIVVNPGSLGQPRDGKGFSYVFVDTEKKEIEFKNICFDKTALYEQIDKFDPSLEKLKKVLERGNNFEKNISYGNKWKCGEWNIKNIEKIG